MNELYAGIGTVFQFIEYIPVENKNGNDGIFIF
jgi:hypothetical protein